MKKSEKFTIPLWEKLKKENKEFKVITGHLKDEIKDVHVIELDGQAYLLGLRCDDIITYSVSKIESNVYTYPPLIQWEEKEWEMVFYYGTVTQHGYTILNNGASHYMYMAASPSNTLEAFFFNENDCKDFINKKNNE